VQRLKPFEKGRRWGITEEQRMAYDDSAWRRGRGIRRGEVEKKKKKNELETHERGHKEKVLL
jgi:hypothetical protein